MSSSLRTPTPRPAAGSRITIEAIMNGRAADEDPFADDDNLPSPSTMLSTIPPPASKQKTLQRAPLLLSEEFPAVSFNHKKVSRKLHEQAFEGKEEVRLTAIKATDAEGLLALTTTEIPSDDEDEDEDDEEDEDEEVTVLGSRAATSTPRPPSSQAAAIESARKRKRDASVASSQQTPLPPMKRQHRNVPEGHSQLGNISKTLTAILATRQTRHTVRATDIEAAVYDIKERFGDMATDKEIKLFKD
ncbi:hypothetical protein H9Q69_007444 [Fusarium xylarioides]|nr:hypothetical protein H9Q69_007444 [Fusarium xylarioides]